MTTTATILQATIEMKRETSKQQKNSSAVLQGLWLEIYFVQSKNCWKYQIIYVCLYVCMYVLPIRLAKFIKQTSGSLDCVA